MKTALASTSSQSLRLSTRAPVLNGYSAFFFAALSALSITDNVQLPV
ncbi:hypothetical protein ACFQY8_02520 [Alloscardovia venturai]|uniref:Uncharacterized protein n=1 Tax=Alloscardovia venturai TaxID=1769421 RepID=A0ABW2Y2Y2_9BIFI